MDPLLLGLSTFSPWLMDYTIDISILICLIFFIRLFTFNKLPAWWHYSLWIILLLRMILPWRFENNFDIPNVVPISIDKNLFESILIEEESAISKITPGLSPDPQGWCIHVNDVLMFLWLAGIIFLGIYVLVKNIRFRNALNKEPMLTEKKVLDLLEECKHRMKTQVPLKITVSDKIKSPALFGYFRPRLLLPVGVHNRLSSAELFYIFMHELGHLKRHDIGVSWLITFLHIFQWFNPFVWVAFYQMRIDQESACDASVLSRIKNYQTIDYAGTIVSFLERFCRNQKIPALVGILESQTQIKKRITMIINYRRNSKKMMLFSTTSLLFICYIFFSIAGVSKQNNEKPGVDLSIQQISYKDKVAEVKVIADAKNISMSAQDSITVNEAVLQNGINQEIKQNVAKVKSDNINNVTTTDELTYETQNIISLTQTGGIKEKIEKKSGNDIKATMSMVQDSNADNEKKGVLPAVETHKSSEEDFKKFKEAYNIYTEDTDLQNSYPSELNKNNQTAQTAFLPQKGHNYSKDDNIKYLGLASVVNYMSKGQDNSKEYPGTSEKKSDGEDIINLKEVDEPPKIMSYYPLRYPFQAKVKGIEGRVLLRFVVDKEGNVLDPQVVSAEPKGVFEQAALDTVIKYRIKPAVKDGKSVNTVVKLPINFAISDSYLRLAQR
jgi:bla regulator protein blaR1